MVSRSRDRSLKRITAVAWPGEHGAAHSGEKTFVTLVAEIGERASFARSVRANASAVAASTARTSADDRTRVKASRFYGPPMKGSLGQAVLSGGRGQETNGFPVSRQPSL